MAILACIQSVFPEFARYWPPEMAPSRGAGRRNRSKTVRNRGAKVPDEIGKGTMAILQLMIAAGVQPTGTSARV